MGRFIMSLDQGTTSSRCIIFDENGGVRAKAQREFKQHYPQAGWVEHDPRDIWESQLAVAKEAFAMLAEETSAYAGIGITNQRETTVVWERETGKPIYNAIVWQCRRTAGMIDALTQEQAQTIRERTGLVPDAYFSATKIKWILDNVAGARELAEAGKLCAGTVDAWLIWNLTGGKVFATDMTNASRTMLYNIHTLQWDPDLLRIFGIPEGILPEVKPSSAIYGTARSKLFGGEIPIAAAAGDQHAALFGQCAHSAGDAKNTYGTGCFLLMNIGEKPVTSQNSLLTTIAVGFADHVEYALEGSVFVGGAVLQWLRDELGLIESAQQADRLAETVADTAGAYVVPAFTGLGAPHWDQYARGTIVGLTRGCKKAHLVRAALESIAYQTHDVLRAMERDTGTRITSLKVDGGASVSDFLMRFQADILNAEVVRPACAETTALGAAYLAGLASGVWRDKGEIAKLWQRDRVYSPAMSAEKREALLSGWRRAVDRSFGWAER